MACIRRCLAFAAVALAPAAGGCGADEAAESPASEQAGSAEVEVVALGDSITSGTPGYDPDPEARAALGFGDDQRSQYEYWATQADPGLGFRNCGVFGERTDEIGQRLDACVDDEPDVLIVQGGINDIAQGGPSQTRPMICGAMVEAGCAGSGSRSRSPTCCHGTTATPSPTSRSPSSTG